MNWPVTAAPFPAPGVDPQVNPLNFSDIGYDITRRPGARRRRDLERR